MKIIPEANFDEVHESSLIQELQKKGLIICGDEHQSKDFYFIPLFDDGYILLSMRRWGEIMAIAVNQKLGKDIYTYMDFYMRSTCPLTENIFQKYIDKS